MMLLTVIVDSIYQVMIFVFWGQLAPIIIVDGIDVQFV